MVLLTYLWNSSSHLKICVIPKNIGRIFKKLNAFGTEELVQTILLQCVYLEHPLALEPIVNRNRKWRLY